MLNLYAVIVSVEEEALFGTASVAAVVFCFVNRCYLFYYLVVGFYDYYYWEHFTFYGFSNTNIIVIISLWRSEREWKKATLFSIAKFQLLLYKRKE